MRYQRKVSTYQSSFAITISIERLWCTIIICFFPFQTILEALYKFIFRLSIIKSSGHRCMQRSDLIFRKQVTMENGNITKSNDPFRMFFELCEIDLVYYPSCS